MPGDSFLVISAAGSAAIESIDVGALAHRSLTVPSLTAAEKTGDQRPNDHRRGGEGERRNAIPGQRKDAREIHFFMGNSLSLRSCPAVVLLLLLACSLSSLPSLLLCCRRL